MSQYQAVVLLCGVPASGKTWVMKQLTGKYTPVQNDDYIAHNKAYLAEVVTHAALGKLPVLVDCPFGERELKGLLESRGLKVYPFFIVEPAEEVAQRYARREGKPASKSTLTRAATIADRANEWSAPQGTSAEILERLRELVV